MIVIINFWDDLEYKLQYPLVLRIVLPNLLSDLVTKPHTQLVCRVPGPFHDSCTPCIVGVARTTSVKPRLDRRASGWQLLGPSGGSRNQETLYSKIQSRWWNTARWCYLSLWYSKSLISGDLDCHFAWWIVYLSYPIKLQIFQLDVA